MHYIKCLPCVKLKKLKNLLQHFLQCCKVSKYTRQLKKIVCTISLVIIFIINTHLKKNNKINTKTARHTRYKH